MYNKVYFIGCTNPGIVTQPRLQCSIPGLCIGGALLGYKATTEERQCTEICNDDPSCKWSSLNPTQGSCLMFSECPEIKESNCDGCLTNEHGCTLNQCNSAGKCEVSPFI